MARHFTPRDMLRRLPSELLLEFFESEKITFPCQDINNQEEVYQTWFDSPAAVRERIEQMLTMIHQFGTRHGVGVLMEDALFMSAAKPDPDRNYGFEAIALWMLIHEPIVFHRARLFHQSESLYERYWHCLTGLPSGQPDFSPETIQQLRQKICQYLREEQGRGHRCSIETYQRNDHEYYLCCYPDDYTETQIVHNQYGTLQRLAVRRAFEIIYHVDTRSGTLSVYAPVVKAAREVLTSHFCKTVLTRLLPILTPVLG